VRAPTGHASAPRRVCLAGETLDWMIGGPSVVAAIPLRTRATAHLVDTCPELTIRSGRPIDAGRTVPTAALSDLAGDQLDYVQAVAYLTGHAWPAPPSGVLHLSSELPVGAGVSSSASATVCAAAALLAARHEPPPAATAARIAYLAERTAGSGAGWMDFLAVAHGGVNLIESSDPPTVRRLADRLTAPTILIDTLARRSTRRLLAAKRIRWQAGDNDLLGYVDSAQTLVGELADALRAACVGFADVGSLITEAHRLLGRINRAPATPGCSRGFAWHRGTPTRLGGAAEQGSRCAESPRQDSGQCAASSVLRSNGDQSRPGTRRLGAAAGRLALPGVSGGSQPALPPATFSAR